MANRSAHGQAGDQFHKSLLSLYLARMAEGVQHMRRPAQHGQANRDFQQERGADVEAFGHEGPTGGEIIVAQKRCRSGKRRAVPVRMASRMPAPTKSDGRSQGSRCASPRSRRRYTTGRSSQADDHPGREAVARLVMAVHHMRRRQHHRQRQHDVGRCAHEGRDVGRPPMPRRARMMRLACASRRALVAVLARGVIEQRVDAQPGQAEHGDLDQGVAAPGNRRRSRRRCRSRRSRSWRFARSRG